MSGAQDDGALFAAGLLLRERAEWDAEQAGTAEYESWCFRVDSVNLARRRYTQSGLEATRVYLHGALDADAMACHQMLDELVDLAKLVLR